MFLLFLFLGKEKANKKKKSFCLLRQKPECQKSWLDFMLHSRKFYLRMLVKFSGRSRIKSYLPRVASQGGQDF